MAEYVHLVVAVMGRDADRDCCVPVGTSIGELRVLQDIPQRIELRIKGEVVNEDYELTEANEGNFVIGARDSKGGV
jgi:hypothetical protein